MKSKILQWFAIMLMVEAGLIHLITAQIEYDKAPYLGYLSMLNLLGAMIAIFGIYHKQAWGWMIGFVISVGSIAGFIWTRTLGLPGLKIEPWLYPFGLMIVSVEGLFILLCLLRPWRIIPSENAPFLVPKWFRYLLPISSLLLISAVTFSTYRWDAYASQVGYHEHVGSLDAVCSTPLTSLAELEEKYGIQVSLVAITAMNSFVDVRLKITDPDKAHFLLMNQNAILVDRKVLILAPHMHTHWKLKTDKLFMMFFPTQNFTVQSGSEVSLVFGRIRVEPIIVK
ncbi:MAG: hypothetical protein HZB50_06455 [Chloroflexi bacterium]|nr:hypothetical protein [Chloroflexota bacterium]